MNSAGIRQSVVDGWDVLVMRNETLEVSIIPSKGSDIWQIQHLPSGSAILWQSPDGLPRGARVPPNGRFEDWYEGGWQDLLPNGGAACVVDGVRHRFHGESWMLRWNWQQRGAALELDVTLGTVPLQIEKRLELDGGTLRLHERIANMGGNPVRFMWGQHIALGGDLLTEGALVDLAGADVHGFYEPVDDTSRLAPLGRSRWPHATGKDGRPVDLQLVPGPEMHTHDVTLLTGLRADWYAVRNPKRRLGFAVRFPANVFRWLWMWQAYGAALDTARPVRLYVLALEPWTSPPCLARAAARGQTRTLAPGRVVEITLEATVFEATGVIRSVEPNGRINQGQAGVS